MSQLSIIVPRDQLHNFLTFAGQEELLHILSVPEKSLPSGADRYDTTDLVTRSTAVRNRLSGLGSIFGPNDALPERLSAPVEDLKALAGFLDQETAMLERSARDMDESSTKLQTELDRAQALARFVGGLESMGISLDAIGGGTFLTTLAGEVPQDAVQPLQKALDVLSYGNLIFAITAFPETTQTFIAILPSPFEEEARQTIAALGSSLESSWKDLPADPAQARKVLDNRLKEIQDTSKQLGDDRRSQVKEFGPRWKALSVLSEILEIRLKALSGSSTTESTCMLRAWVPNDKVQQFAEGAAKACNELTSVHTEESIQQRHADTHSNHQGELSTNSEQTPPTLVRVPRWAQPLQSIINNFGTPSYNEMNPLPFMIISYPLIYGLMFGDFGQGPIFILLGFIFLRAKRKGTKVPMGDIGQLIVGGAELMILLGIGITIFGFVFGDFFGFESAELFGLHPLFNPTEGALNPNLPPEERIKNLQTFMGFMLLFGVGHYTFGLALSAYNKIRRHEYSETLFGPVAWTIFYLSLVYLVYQFIIARYKFSALLKDPFSIPIAVVLLVALGLMGRKEGPIHVLEAFTSAGSNTLSYLRIWALNIADFFVKVAMFTAFGIGGAIAGNLLVMIIEALIVFVQTLRLHWVEWFSKFYEGNGLSFAPYQEPKSWIVPVVG